MLQATSQFVGSLPGFEAVGGAATAEAALDALTGAAAGAADAAPAVDGPDLVLADVSLPGMSGIELVAALRERRPGLPCLMFSAHQEASYAERALAAGARGYVVKGRLADLEEGLRTALAGEVYLSPPLREKLRARSGFGT